MTTAQQNRRSFLLNVSVMGAAAAVSGGQALAMDNGRLDGAELKIGSISDTSCYHPLQILQFTAPAGRQIQVLDSRGSVYHEFKSESENRIRIGGTLGHHFIVMRSKTGAEQDVAAFHVDCHSAIRDEKQEFSRIMDMLRYTMDHSGYGVAQTRRMNGKLYHYYSSWFQDHMYIAKGKKYFYRMLKSGVNLYTDGQRKDGMIHDNYKHPYSHTSSWSDRFDYGNFVTVPEDEHSSCIYVRVPVENIAEFTYLESVYDVWKITGDFNWMQRKLDSMLKAVDYATTDPYRWSEEYKLLKRGYTIDIWDFQSIEDAERAGGDIMRVYLDKTKFNIMYGDNVRLAQSCLYLSEMLRAAGRADEAKRMEKLGRGLKRRIDELSWNGRFYTHQIPIDPVQRDFGDTDTLEQVTLSNAWALNHGVTHEQAVAIIRTYQRIREQMPETSPGEWYCCYPPFEKGWHVNKWEYMNGGVSPIAAGELARGALEHGYESYGADILRRVYDLAQQTNNVIQGCYKGKIIPPPPREFTTLDLRDAANADLHGDGAPGVPGWTGEGDNDLRNMPVGDQVFHDIPFAVIDPAKNSRRAVLALSGDPDYKQESTLNLNQKAASLYVLHTMGGGAGNALCAGSVTLHYADGSSHTRYMYTVGAKEIGNWWQPSVPNPRKGIPQIKVAWRGENPVTNDVGVYVFGLNNPNPDNVIESIEFNAMKSDVKWMILGLTLCDAQVYFKPSIVSTIPQQWAAAECMYALMEGLAGIQNAGTAFDRARIAPRWSAAGVKKVSATAKYEASGGYVSYEYRYDQSSKQLSLTFTGSADHSQVDLLLPEGARVRSAHLNAADIPVRTLSVEQSVYLSVAVEGKGPHELTINLKTS
ncbi:MAG: hypothetical protein U5R06_19715 [candidate division KSB1 bacterium]|nr:hypothetical protein [candidate division KSB1 bacterium]